MGIKEGKRKRKGGGGREKDKKRVRGERKGISSIILIQYFHLFSIV